MGAMPCRLVENEIGGVIIGSLNAAQRKRPLTETEYLEEIRSNIPNKNDEGLAKRKKVYGEFVQYGQWKKENNKYDVGDIVLELIKLGATVKCQEFVSAYLDEVSSWSMSRYLYSPSLLSLVRCLLVSSACHVPAGPRLHVRDYFLDL